MAAVGDSAGDGLGRLGGATNCKQGRGKRGRVGYRRWRVLAAALATAGLVGLGGAAKGSAIYWRTAADGTWGTAGCWNPSSVPGSSDDAYFNLGSSSGYTVNVAAGATVNSLTVNSDRVTLSPQNGVTLNSGNIYLGPNVGNSGQLTLSGPGSTSASNIYVGGNSSASGGAGTLGVSSGTTTVNGTLRLWHGGTLNLTGGTLNVAWLDTATTYLTYGNFAGGVNLVSGTLALTGSLGADMSGGVPVDQRTWLGFTTLNTGMTLNVPNGPVCVGRGGANGYLTMSGGTLSAQNVYVGDTVAAGQVSFNSGSMTVAGTLKIYNTSCAGLQTAFNLSGGTLNVGTLDTSGNSARFNWTGGTLSIGSASVDSGSALGSSLSLSATKVLQAGSGGLAVGNSGNGTLTQTGGALAVAGDIRIAPVSGYATSTYDMQGGTASATNIWVGGSSSAWGGAGVLNVGTGAALTASGTFKIWNTTGTAVNLSGGTLNVGTLDTNGNPARFNWTGGAFGITAGSLYITSADPGVGNWIAPSGLTLAGGKTLAVSSILIVGTTSGSTGSVTQTGGSSSAGQIILAQYGGSTGTYTLNGTGALTTGSMYVGGGSGSTGGGAGTLTISSGGSATVSGTLKVWNTSGTAVNLSGGALSVGALDTNGNPSRFLGNGTTTGWTGGTLNVTGSSGLAISSSGPLGASLTVGSGKMLGVTNELYITAGGSVTITGSGSVTAGTIRQDGGSVALSGVNPTLTFTTYNQSGGTSGGVHVAGSATYNQSGGTADGVSVGTGGTYSQSGGTLGRVDVFGTYNYSGGTVTGSVTYYDGAINLNANLATAGQLTQESSSTLSIPSGRTVTVGSFFQEAGTVALTGTLNSSGNSIIWFGPFTQTGGSHSAGWISVAHGGTYALQGGSATATSVDVGDSLSAGRLNISGTGNLGVGGTLKVWNTSGTMLTLSGAGATLSVGTLDTNGNPSNFYSHWTGGTLNITGSGGLAVDSSGPLGAGVSLGAFSTLNVTNTLTVDTSGSVMALWAGALSAGTVALSNGSFTQMSGTLTATTFTQTGGTASFSGALALGSGAGKVATYNMQGGTLSAGSISMPGGTYTQSGGSVTAGSLDASGASSFSFNAGSITVNGGTFTPKINGLSINYGGGWESYTGVAISCGDGSGSRPTLALQGGASSPLGSNSLLVGLNGAKGGVNVGGSGSISSGIGGYAFVGAGRSPVTGTDAGDGALNVASGGQVSIYSTVTVGYAGGKGVVSADGTSSTVASAQGSLFIGCSRYVSGGVDRGASDGTLNLTNGGQASAYIYTYVGFSGGKGVVSVDGANSKLLTTSNSLSVGGFRYVLGSTDYGGGDGTLNLTNGGQASTPAPVFVGDSGGKGVVNVGKSNGTDAGGSKLTGADLLLGSGCSAYADAGGTLNVFPGGTVEVAGTSSVYTSALTALNLAGGTLKTGSLYLDAPSLFNWTGGTLNVTGAAGLSVGSSGPLASVTLASGKTLNVTNTLSVGTGGALVVSGGTLAAGAISQTDGTVNIPTLTLASSGGNAVSYAQSGGTLSATTININSGGTLRLGYVDNFNYTFNASTVNLNAGGAYVEGGPYSGSALRAVGVFNMNGGTASGIVQVTGGFNYTSGDATAADVILDAGSANFPADVTLGGLAQLSPTAVADIAAGRTVHVLSSLEIDGTLNLYGTLTSTAHERVANVNQTGTNTISGILTVNGAYNLSGGTLSAASVTVNAGGSINWTGGTLNVTGSGGLSLGTAGPLASVTLGSGKTLNVANTLSIGTGGALTLSGGTLTAGTIALNNGSFGETGGTLLATAFTQSGGTASFAGTLVLGSGSGKVGLYTLTAGTLSVGALDTGGDALRFVQTGGTLIITGDGGLLVDASGPLGASITLAAGQSLGVSSMTLDTPASSVAIVGGSLSAGTVLMTNGTFSRTSGTLTATTFTQTGGAAAFTGTLGLGSGAGQVGAYNLQGGALSADALVNSGGSFNLTGGNLIASAITLGDGGVMNTAAPLIGTNPLVFSSFTQTGGAHTVSVRMGIGSPAGSTYTISGGSLTSTDRLQIGNDLFAYQGSPVAGSVVQTGGTVSAYIIDMGYRENALNSNASYALSGGSLTAADVWVGEFSNGTGSAQFIHSGGTATLGYLFVGLNYPGTCSYQLSGGGVLNGTNYEAVGGWGVFAQSGGSNTTANLDIGANAGTASYTLSGGALSAGQLWVGANGSFAQTGGTFSAGNVTQIGGTATFTGLTLAASGGNATSYNLSGGVLSTPTLNTSGDPSRLNWTGGTLSITGPDYFNITFSGPLGGAVTIGAGKVLAVANGLQVIGGSALTLGAGSINSGTLAVGPGSTITQTGGSLSSGAMAINGLYDQQAGTANVGGQLTLSSGATSGATYRLSGGSLSVGAWMGIGLDASTHDAAFVHSAGTCSVTGSLYVGYLGGSVGTYSLSGTGSLTAGAMYVGGGEGGAGGTGAFSVSGGTAAISGTATVWPTGTVNLSGGSLSVGSLDTSGDPSRFNWTGGTLNTTGSGGLAVNASGPLGAALTVGTGKTLGVTNGISVSTGGALSVSGGGVTAGSVYLSGGSYAQSGGTATVGWLYVGIGGTGSCSLSGSGSLATSYAMIGYSGSTGSFTQTGGTHTVGIQMELGSANGTSNGTYNLQGGSLSAPTEMIGSTGTGSFIQTGGSNAVAGSLSLASVVPGSSGSYAMSNAASSLAAANVSVGGSAYDGGGAGSFTMTGGAATVTGTLKIWDTGAAAPRGTMVNLSGGSLIVGSLDTSGNPSRFNWTGGTFGLTGPIGLSVGSGGVLGANVALPAGKSLAVTAATTIAAGASVQVQGGTFSTGSLVLQGTLSLQSGTFNLTNSDLAVGTSGLLGSAVTIGPGMNVAITRNTSVNAGAAVSVLGGSFATGGLTNSGKVSVMDGALGLAGASTNAAGGQIKAIDGTINLGSGSGRLVNYGQMKLIDVIVNGDVECLGGGTLETAGTVTFNGNVTGSPAFPGSGEVVFAAMANLAGVSGPGRTTVSPAATLASGAIRQSALSVGAGAHASVHAGSAVSVLGALAIAPGGVLDLVDNAAVVKSGSLADVEGMVEDGRLVSSAVDAEMNQGLAVLTAAQAMANGNPLMGGFHGEAVGSAEILVQYGWNGDLNMDERVDYLDYGVIDNAYLNHAAARDYAHGDINRDDVINYLDYGMMDNAYLAQTAPHGAAMTAAATNAGPASAVPEPSGLGLLGVLLGLGVMRRRGRLVHG